MGQARCATQRARRRCGNASVEAWREDDLQCSVRLGCTGHPQGKPRPDKWQIEPCADRKQVDDFNQTTGSERRAEGPQLAVGPPQKSAQLSPKGGCCVFEMESMIERGGTAAAGQHGACKPEAPKGRAALARHFVEAQARGAGND